MIQIDFLDCLRDSGRSAFSTREFAGRFASRGYARLVLHRLHEKKKILKVRNGWWSLSNGMAEAAACAVSAPCYVSFHSALNLHNLTTQIPLVIQVAFASGSKGGGGRNARRYEIMGRQVREYKIPGKFFNDFSAVDGVLLASKEKAFADSILLPRSCPEAVLTEALPGVDVSEVRRLLSFSKFALKRFERLVKNAAENRFG